VGSLPKREELERKKSDGTEGGISRSLRNSSEEYVGQPSGSVKQKEMRTISSDKKYDNWELAFGREIYFAGFKRGVRFHGRGFPPS